MCKCIAVTYIFGAKRFAADCLGDSLLGLGDEVMLLRYGVMSCLYLSCMPMLLADTFKESPFAASAVLESELQSSEGSCCYSRPSNASG